MPNTPPPKDRFDDLPADNERIGAHRAESPHIHGGYVVLWSVVAIVVLVAGGIFATMVATGRITLFPAPSPAMTQQQAATPVVDTSYAVYVINATSQSGLAGTVADEVVAAGWSEDDVSATEADQDDFEVTTVYYAMPEDEGVARGLAGAIGGAQVELNDSYQPVDDPDTDDVDEGAAKQLVIVIGLDRTDAGAATPSS